MITGPWTNGPATDDLHDTERHNNGYELVPDEDPRRRKCFGLGRQLQHEQAKQRHVSSQEPHVPQLRAPTPFSIELRLCVESFVQYLESTYRNQT